MFRLVKIQLYGCQIMGLRSCCCTLLGSTMAAILNSKQGLHLTICLNVVEALLVATNLGLFAYGYPDVARKSLWEEGGTNGFNSDPRLRIYFYATI